MYSLSFFSGCSKDFVCSSSHHQVQTGTRRYRLWSRLQQHERSAHVMSHAHICWPGLEGPAAGFLYQGMGQVKQTGQRCPTHKLFYKFSNSFDGCVLFAAGKICHLSFFYRTEILYDSVCHSVSYETFTLDLYNFPQNWKTFTKRLLNGSFLLF